MQKRVLLLGLVISFLVLTGRITSFSQEVPQAAGSETEMQWLWGEIVSVDTQKNELTVKCLDYETEEEKEISIILNEQTLYENVSALSEIASQDVASIDYIVGSDGKNIAKVISVEKPGIELAPEQEVVPEDTSSTAVPVE